MSALVTGLHLARLISNLYVTYIISNLYATYNQLLKAYKTGDRASWALGFSGSRSLGFSGFRVLGFSGSQVARRVLSLSRSQVLGFLGSRVLGLSVSWVPGVSNSQVLLLPRAFRVFVLVFGVRLVHEGGAKAISFSFLFFICTYNNFILGAALGPESEP